MKLTRRKVIGGLAALLAAGGVVGFLKRMSSGVYSGPVSDHFDGTRFVGPYAVRSNGTLAFWKWRFTRQPAVWPAWIENKRTDKPPARLDNGLRVSFVGHATYLVQTAGLNILVDPVWAERASPFRFAGGAKRVHAPGIAFDDLPKIDAVLVTHGHYDHLDVETLGRLNQRDNRAFSRRSAMTPPSRNACRPLRWPRWIGTTAWCLTTKRRRLWCRRSIGARAAFMTATAPCGAAT